MADWAEDDNPFAAQTDDASPFNDPAVAQAQSSSTMPEYDPFSASVGGAPKKAAAPAPAGPADAPDWATSEEKPKNATAEEQRRAKDYDAAEAQTEVRKDPGYRPANWPPFPGKCVWPFKPCFHHDFRGELPAYGYNVTKHGYYYWLGYFFTLFWNMICAAAAMSVSYSGSGAGLGLAFAYLFFFAPLAYLCWFQSLYKAIMKDGASNLTWGWFFFSYLFQLVFVCLMALGYPGFGGIGIWTASVVVSKDTGIGIMCWTSAIMWVMLGLYQMYHFKWALTVFKTSGGSFEGAQKEAQQMAAAGAVAAAVAK